jgi:virginiamycin A acetyltransferase
MPPDPTHVHPLAAHPRVVYLRPLVDDPRVDVGEYTYYDDAELTNDFLERNVLYRNGPERLVIGRYTAIAHGVRFIMSGGNHPMVGIGTYPFSMFGGEWMDATRDIILNLPSRGDTVVGNNVWLGLSATIMPGTHIGDGAIVGAGAVVSRDVPPFGVAVGNPARVVKKRFTDPEIDTLLKVAWWNWPVEKVTQHARTILAGDVASLAALADCIAD